MEETKHYKDYLLTPYMDGVVDDLPLKSGHERYLTYMPKTSEGHLTEGATATRRAHRSDHDGITIEQTFQNKDCTVSMNINSYNRWFPGVQFTDAEDAGYTIDAAAKGNRQFDVSFESNKRTIFKQSWNELYREFPSKSRLEGLDMVLDQIQSLDGLHPVRLAEGTRLALSDRKQLTMLVEAVTARGRDAHLREVQILTPKLSAKLFESGITVSSTRDVEVIRRGSDDIYLNLGLSGVANELIVYAEGVPVPGVIENPYDIEPEKVEEMHERVPESANSYDRLPGIINSVRERKLEAYERSLVAWDAVERDSSRLSYHKVVNLNDADFETAVKDAVKDALYHVSREYRTDRELKRREEQQLDISDLSEDTQQSEL